jgi:hypothetical protein
MKPGTYLARVASHAISETKKGDPQAVVTFEVSTNGATEKITYYGSFSEKAAPYTIKALLACGLKTNNPSGDLEVGKEVSLVIDDDVGTDGKTRSKVKWVNSLGATRNVIPQDLAKAKLAALEGAVMAARNELNIQVEDDSDLPF